MTWVGRSVRPACAAIFAWSIRAMTVIPRALISVSGRFLVSIGSQELRTASNPSIFISLIALSCPGLREVILITGIV
jgi:hypothetical protein